jgi:hypothetical protein
VSGDDTTEPIAPLGRYHSRDVCHHCGANGELTMVVVRTTRAWAWQCVDTIGCERRFYRRRQLDLFGNAA